MGLVHLGRDDVVASGVGSLGFDPTAVDLEVPEVLAEATRRTASFRCPTTPVDLERSVDEILNGLGSFKRTDTGESAIRGMIETLVGYGDLVEAPIDDEVTGTARRRLFLAQPSYVVLSAETCALVGIRANGLPLGDGSVRARISHFNHARYVRLLPGQRPEEDLGASGLRELSSEQWLGHPPEAAPDSVVSDFTKRLAAAGPSGSIGPIRILDPTSSIRFYRGRWRTVTDRDTGRFVARRPVDFGADQWCYCEVKQGEVTNLLDLPAFDRLARGCDEAWRLQAALDALAGTPQVLGVRHDQRRQEAVLRFKSPVPSWDQRRLDAVGEPLGHQAGCLFAYRITAGLLESELASLKRNMWLEIEQEGETQ